MVSPINANIQKIIFFLQMIVERQDCENQILDLGQIIQLLMVP